LCILFPKSKASREKTTLEIKRKKYVLLSSLKNKKIKMQKYITMKKSRRGSIEFPSVYQNIANPITHTQSGTWSTESISK
jgi:hypothetical protein